MGVTYAEYASDPDTAIDTIVAKYSAIAQRCDAVVVLGSDYDDIETGSELDHNAVIAANLNSPILYVCSAGDRTVDQVLRFAESAIEASESRHNTIVAIVATHADERHAGLPEALRTIRDVPVSMLPENPVLGAPSVEAQFQAVGATQWLGQADFSSVESLHTIVGAMTLPNLLARLKREATVIVPADRLDLLPGLVMAHRSAEYGPLSAIVLTGGFQLPESVSKLFADSAIDLPIAVTEGDTFSTAVALQNVRGTSTSSPRKIDVSRALFAANVDEQALLTAIDLPRTEIRTPTMFEHQAMQMARSNRQRIVLPEATDDRILQAAEIVSQRSVADLILLGDSAKIASRASGARPQPDRHQHREPAGSGARRAVRPGVRPPARAQGHDRREGA